MSDANAIRADVDRAKELVPWEHMGSGRLAMVVFLPKIVAHCETLLAENEHHLRANAELSARVVELEAALKQAESRIYPGLFYKCGCPVLRSDRLKGFCDTHCKTIRDDAPEGTP